MRVFGKALPPKAATLQGTNIVLLGFCIPALLAVRGWSTAGGSGSLPETVFVMARLIPVGLFCQVVFYYHELYNLQIIRNFGDHVWRLLQGAGIAMIVLALIYVLVPGWSPGQGALLALAPCVIIVLILTRLFALPGRRARVAIIGPEQSRDAVRTTIEACS